MTAILIYFLINLDNSGKWSGPFCFFQCVSRDKTSELWLLELPSSSQRENSHRSEGPMEYMHFKNASLSVLLQNEIIKDDEVRFFFSTQLFINRIIFCAKIMAYFGNQDVGFFFFLSVGFIYLAALVLAVASGIFHWRVQILWVWHACSVVGAQWPVASRHMGS